MTTPAPHVKVVHRSDRYFIGTLEDVVCLRFSADPGSEAVEQLAVQIQEIAETHARAVVILHCSGECDHLQAGTRAALTHLMRQSFAKSHAWAAVVDGSGQGAARLRTSLTELHAEANVHLRMRILSTVSSAGSWASQLSTKLPSGSDLLPLFRASSTS